MSELERKAILLMVYSSYDPAELAEYIFEFGNYRELGVGTAEAVGLVGEVVDNGH